MLDDGRGDLAERSCDLGLIALDDSHAQLRVGREWGPVLSLDLAASALVDLARRFLGVRGEAADAPWHVDELSQALVPAVTPDPRAMVLSAPLPFGVVDSGTHVAVPDGVLDTAGLARLAPHVELVVTPWHGVLVPGGEEDQ